MLPVKELKSLNRKELLKELKEARHQTQKVRLTLKTGHEKNTSFSKKWKRQTARILTFLNELGFQEALKDSKELADLSAAKGKEEGDK